MTKVLFIGIIIYMLGMLLTFGYAYHRIEPRYFDNGMRNSAGEDVICLMSTILWPFYWSQRFQRPEAEHE